MAGEQPKIFHSKGGDEMEVSAGGGKINLNDVAGLVLSDAALQDSSAGTLTIPSLPSGTTSASTKKWIEVAIGSDTYYVPAIKHT